MSSAIDGFQLEDLARSWTWHDPSPSRLSMERTSPPDPMDAIRPASQSSESEAPSSDWPDELDLQVQSIRQTELYRLMRPLMVHMELSQLLHVRQSNEHSSHRLRRVRSSDARWQKLVLRCLRLLRSAWDVAPLATVGFSLVSLPVYVFEVGRLVRQMEFASINMELFVFGFMLENFVSLAVMYVKCESGAMLRLFRAYSELAKDDEQLKRRLDATVVRTSKLILAGCVTMNVFICLSFQLFLLYSYTHRIDTGCFGATAILVVTRTPFYFYYSMLGVLVIAPPFTLMAGLLCALCVILRASYEAVNDQIKKAVQLDDEDADIHQADDSDVWPSLAKHRRITQMVELASQLFGPYLLTFVLVNLTLACFLVYIVLFSCRSNALGALIQLGWVLCALLVAFFFFFHAIQVHNRATKCWDDLSAIRLKRITSQHGVHLAVFLERLSSKRVIGISGCGFFIVTQEFFIWTLWSLLSYFLVLTKFSPPEDFCASANSTCG